MILDFDLSGITRNRVPSLISSISQIFWGSAIRFFEFIVVNCVSWYGFSRFSIFRAPFAHFQRTGINILYLNTWFRLVVMKCFMLLKNFSIMTPIGGFCESVCLWDLGF